MQWCSMDRARDMIALIITFLGVKTKLLDKKKKFLAHASEGGALV